MRTLVISDLHLGSLLDRDVLRRPQALAILESRVAQMDRLVLLGDTLELLEGRPEAAREAARPVLKTLGGALGSSGQVIVGPGNHDHALIRHWLSQRVKGGQPLRLSTQVPRGASDLLEELCGWLAPAQVEVRYPGVWLGEGIFAMHGHYGDRHVLGALAWWGGDAPPEQLSVSDYERAPGSDSGALTEAVAGAMPDQLADGVELGAGLLRQVMLRGLPVAAKLPGAANVAAAAALVHLVHDQNITCRIEGHDGFRRGLGRCIVGGRDVNAAMVESGYALASVSVLRPLEAAELAVFASLLRAAALRFWLSRLWDLHLPRQAAMLQAHDPAPF